MGGLMVLSLLTAGAADFVAMESSYTNQVPRVAQTGVTAYFEASGGTSYEWDFDYDGTTFNLDASGAQVSNSWGTAGRYVVMLRVDGGPTEVQKLVNIYTGAGDEHTVECQDGTEIVEDTVNTNSWYSGTVDTHTDSWVVGGSYGTQPYMMIQDENDNESFNHAFVRMPVPAPFVPSGCGIVDAKLILDIYRENSNISNAGDSNPLDDVADPRDNYLISIVRETWDDNLTWSQEAGMSIDFLYALPMHSNTILDHYSDLDSSGTIEPDGPDGDPATTADNEYNANDLFPAPGSTSLPVEFDITLAVEQWVTDGAENWGVRIMLDDNGIIDGGCKAQLSFRSSETGAAPKLVITYVDPAATTQTVLQQGSGGYNGCEDTWVRNGSPDDNRGGDTRLDIEDYYGTALNDTYIRFDLSGVTPGVGEVVNSAYVSFAVWRENSHGESQVEENLVLSDWAENTLTWNIAYTQSPGVALYRFCTEPGPTMPGYDTAQPDTPGWAYFNVTQAVRFWLAQPLSNLGVCIRGNRDYSSGTDLDLQCHSSENATDVQWNPKLVIQFGKTFDQAPVARISYPDLNPLSDTPSLPAEVGPGTYALDGSTSTDPEGETLFYAWTIDYDDGATTTTSSLVGQTQSLILVDGAYGTYTVYLTVIDARGNTDTTTIGEEGTAEGPAAVKLLSPAEIPPEVISIDTIDLQGTVTDTVPADQPVYIISATTGSWTGTAYVGAVGADGWRINDIPIDVTTDNVDYTVQLQSVDASGRIGTLDVTVKKSRSP